MRVLYEMMKRLSKYMNGKKTKDNKLSKSDYLNAKQELKNIEYELEKMKQ